MPPSRRSPVRGSAGNGGGQRLPDASADERAPTTLDEPEEFESFDDPEAPWGEEDEYAAPLGERIDMLRRKYMPLPDEVVYEFLGEDEYVIHSDHPSFRAFLTQNIALVILIPIAGPLFIFFIQGGITREAVFVFLILDLLVAVLALKRLGDRYTSYVITNLRLIKVTGIVSRKLASIPWTRMTGLGYEQKALGRLLGYATIFIESANEESGLRKFSDVNDPATFHQRLLDHVSAKSGQTGRQPPPPTTGERRGLLQKRKERKRISRDAEAERRRQRTGGDVPPRGGGQRPVGRSTAPRAPTPPEGTPTAGPTRARPKVPGRGPAPGPQGGKASERAARGEPGPPSDEPAPGPAPDEPGQRPTGRPRRDEAAGRPKAAPGTQPRRPPQAADYDPYTDYTDEAASGRAGRPRRDAPGPSARDEPSPPPQDAVADNEDEPTAAEQTSGRWSWWPGTGSAKSTPPVPSPPAGDTEDTAQRRPKRRRRPDQRAPSRRPPETIVVPESEQAGQPSPRRPKQPNRRRPGRFREIDGWQDEERPGPG